MSIPKDRKPADSANSRNESLSDVLPAPVNDDRLPYVANIGLGTIAFTLAGAGAFVLIAGAMTPCVGATRSTKLEWERRKLQMEQAEQAVAQTVVTDADSNVGKQD